MDSATVKAHIIADFHLDVTAPELDDDYDLLDNGVVDSLGLLRLIEWVGRTYHIPVDELDISPADFHSVNAILAFVEASGNAMSVGRPNRGAEQ